MSKPKISIICPCYNGEKYLKEAINSVVDQTFNEWELIIINDGSTDSSADLANRLSKNDSRIRVFDQANMGLSAARNCGISNSEGGIIGFLDADDRYLPDCLTTVYNIFQHGNLDMLIASYLYFKDNLNLHRHKFSNTRVPNEIFLKRNLAPPISHFLNKRIINQIGGFDSTLNSCEDWDYWIRVGKIGAEIHTSSEVLVAYRYVPTSMSRNPLVMYDALTEVSRRAGKPDERLPNDAPHNHEVDLDYPSIQKKHLIRMLGVMLHQGKEMEAAKWYFKEKKVWNWVEEDRDWKGLSSYLSWGYFFDPEQIEKLLTQTVSDVAKFFKLLGYLPAKIQYLIKLIFEPQLKRRNHLKYGKILGGVKNKLGWY